MKHWLLLVFCITASAVQAQWTPWETIYEEGQYPNSTRVQISFKLSTCGKYGLNGYSFYRINNEFKREKFTIHASFFYIDCKGETRETPVTVPLNKPGIDANTGKWFLGHKVVNVVLKKVDDYSVKATGKNNNTTTNGAANEIVFGPTPKMEFEKRKAQLDEKIRNVPNTTYRNYYRIKIDDIVKSKDSYDKKIQLLDALEEEIEKKTAQLQSLREKNETLKEEVKTNIEAVPTPVQQNAFMSEYNSIMAKTDDPETVNTSLKQLNSKVLAETARINKNLQEFENNKTESQTKIDQYKQQGEEIKQQQATIVGGMLAIGAGLALFRNPQGEAFRFRGAASPRFSIQLGLQYMTQPYGANEYTEGSILRRSDGALFPVNEKTFLTMSIGAPGIFAAGSFHPLFAKNIAVGITGNLSFNYWPETYDDGGIATGFSSASNGYKSVFNYNVGAELAVGSRHIKLLLQMGEEVRKINASEASATVFESSATISETTTYHNESQSWSSITASAGFRLGDYTKNGSYFDLAVTRIVLRQINNVKASSVDFEDLIQNFDRSPTALYAMYTHKGSWFGRVVYTLKPYVFDTETPRLYYSDEKKLIEITIGRKLDYFGKTYRKKR